MTGYAVQCRDSFESSYRLLATVKPDATSYTATGLQEGRDYYLRVFSQNAAGLSEHPVELLPAVKARLPFGTQSFLVFVSSSSFRHGHFSPFPLSNTASCSFDDFFLEKS